jgi:hypothetical protein
MNAAKSRQQVVSVVDDLLDAGENVIAVLPFTAVPRKPKAPREGMQQRTRRYRPLVLTTRRLFVLDSGPRTPSPRGVLAVFGSRDVGVVSVTPRRFSGVTTLLLDLAGVGQIPFIVGKHEQSDADVLVATLGHTNASGG